MNLLMVDDCPYILEGIKSGVDFNALGIERVFYAQNIFQARDILSSAKIDIMVADIEMPQGSGLELLQWVRDNNFNVVTMFCTSYADFNYAQKAIELHSFDYYLKPISYDELSRRLARAVEEARKNSRISFKSNAERFWSSVLNDGARAGGADIMKLAADCNMEYKPDDRFILLIVSMDERKDLPAGSNKISTDMGKTVEGYFNTSHTALESIIFFEEYVWILVLKQLTGSFDKISFSDACGSMIKECGMKLSADINCYYAEDCRLAAIPGLFGKLVEMFRDDVTGINAVVNLKEYRKRELEYRSDALKEWEELLTCAKKDELTRKMFSDLDSRVLCGQMNQRVLNCFGMDAMQVIFTVLKDKQIEAHRLFGNETFDMLRRKSLRTVAAMKRFIGYLIETACDYLQFAGQSQTVIDKVTEYIGSHLDEEITRASLGRIVFLNSDYLARLFKKVTGKSIGEYLMDKRIEKAKDLLSKTDLPVNMIALEVGYGNFAYFTKIFHEKTGATPTEFRNKAHQA